MAVGLIAVLKNISVLMDDAATMSKVALKDTVAILGDDLAVNAEKASKFSASREIPVLYAITKGSLLNKVFILPIIFLLSAKASWLIDPILILGAGFLSWEGIHGIYSLFFSDYKEREDISNFSETELLKIEKDKINSAILTDRILSIEIIVIALNSVIKEPMLNQFLIVTFVALVATVGVYGMVALIIRLDDMGHWVIRRSIRTKNKTTVKYKVEGNENLIQKESQVFVNIQLMAFGNFLISLMQPIIKSLAYIGTLAMFVVAGEIFIHKIPILHHFFNSFNAWIIFSGAIALSIIVGFILSLLEKVYKHFKK